MKENLPPVNSQAHFAARLPGRSRPKTPAGVEAMQATAVT